MKKKDQKDKIEFTFRNILRVAEVEDDPAMWSAVIIWCRSKEGGRHKALGRRGDNAWCFDELPDRALLYDPAIMRKTTIQDLPHPDPDPDYVDVR